MKKKIIIYDPVNLEIKFTLYVKSKKEAELFCTYILCRIPNDDIQIVR